MAARLIQICYKEEQRSACYPFAEIHFNNSLTVFFENSVIKERVLTSTHDKISVCSWKLKEKLRWYIGKPRELTQEVLESDYDVLSFTKNTDHHRMIDAANVWHKGFREIMTRVLHHCSIKMPHEVKVPIYQNHFSARLDIYQDYVNNYLRPCMWVMENEPEINRLVMQDSGYNKLAKKDAAIPDFLMDQIGVPYYPLIPFLLERLFSIYCHNKKIKVTPL